jgi:murein hydrolase activator
MKRLLSKTAAFLAWSLLLLHGLDARPAAAVPPEEKLREIRKKIRQEEGIVQEIKSKKSTLLGAIQNIDQKIAGVETQLDRSQRQNQDLARQIRNLQGELGVLEKKIEQRKRETSQRLGAYYRLGRDGLLPVIFSQSTIPEKLRNLDALRILLDTDWSEIQSFHALLQEKQTIEQGLEARHADVKALQERIREEKKELVARRRDKDNLLFRLSKDETLHGQLIQELNESADELEVLLKRAAEVPETPVARRPPDAAPGSPFVSRKGMLSWPVDGVLFRKFGTYHDPVVHAKVKNRGIDIRTGSEEPVRAVWRGVVVFADWFRGHGNLVIVDHGQKYFSVVSHLSRMSKAQGDPVETGEILGYAGDTGSLEGPLVHFEIWNQGRPENPMNWVQKK